MPIYEETISFQDVLELPTYTTNSVRAALIDWFVNFKMDEDMRHDLNPDDEEVVIEITLEGYHIYV